MQVAQTKVLQSEPYSKRVIALIIILFIIRGFIAFTMELGNDESYYWLYSQVLKWNYFDHPPVVALWIRLFTANLQLQQYEGFLRLGSIAGCALSTWFMYKAVASLSTERAGLFAACLYNASFYAGITAGLYSMPDSPQMVFWTFSLWMIAKISTDDRRWIPWILFGIAAGLCIMSKVHGIFIWGGLILFSVLKKRAWLVTPRLYTALLVSGIITSPILIWNIQHDFVTYRFHSERIIIHQFALDPYSFLRELLNQLLFNNPFNVILMLSALIAWRRYRMKRLLALSLYNYIGWPLAGLLLFISLFRDTVLPHWSGPAYVTLLPVAAIWLSEVDTKSLYPKVLQWSLGTFLVVLLAWTGAVHFYPGTFGSKNNTDLGTGDNTLDTHGWQEGGKRFITLYQNDMRRGIMPAGAPVVCYKWWGAHIEYYFCHPAGLQMIGLGNLHDLHEYAWMNNLRKDKVNFMGAYCIMPSDERYDVQARYSGFYSHIDSATVIEIDRSNTPAHLFYVYRLTGWKNQSPIAQVK